MKKNKKWRKKILLMLLSFGVAAVSFSSTTFAAGSGADGTNISGEKQEKGSKESLPAVNSKARSKPAKGDEVVAMGAKEGEAAGHKADTGVDVKGLTIIPSGEANKGTIYANGISITLMGNAANDGTQVYLDSDLSTPLVLSGFTAASDGAYNLSGATVFGGSRDSERTSTHITMNGGNIGTLYGGGDAKAVSGEAKIEINNASVSKLYGGGLKSSVGTATIIANGKDRILSALYGGSSGYSCNNVSIHMTGGNILNMWGGSDGPFDTNGNVNIELTDVNPLVGGLSAGPNNPAVGSAGGSIKGNLDISLSGTTKGTLSVYSVKGGSVTGTSTLSVAGKPNIKVNINGGTDPVTDGFKSIHVASPLTEGGAINAVLPAGYSKGVIGTNVSAGDKPKFTISGAAADKELKLDGTDLIVINKVAQPVTDISDVPAYTLTGVDLPLAATVSPADATNRDIQWTVADAGTTGAHIESGNILKTTASGTVRVKAVITDGKAAGEDFTKEFPLLVMNPVTDITGCPEHAAAGTDLPLTAAVSPADATKKDIMWSVSDGGTTGAAIVKGNVLRTTAPGTVQVKATIVDGAGLGHDFDKNFSISVMRAVTEITDFQSNAVAGTDFPLTGTVSPADATHTAIQWAVSDAGTTGAFIEGGNILKTTAPGTVKVTAVIKDGLAVGVDFTSSFEVSVMRAVTGILDIPSAAVAGTDLPLTGTVTPADATHTAIQWTVTDPGTTGATIVNSETAFSTAMSGESTYFLRTVKAGTVRIKAVIADGSAAGRDFVKEVDITVDKSDAQKLEEAKSKAEDALGGITVTKDTTADEILNAVQQAVNSAGNVSVTWTKGPVITGPTSDKEGSVTGTITLKLGDQTVDIPVNFTIPRLPVTNEETLDSAASQAETVLGQLTADNNTTPDSIQKAVQDAAGPGVIVKWLKDPVIIPATTEREGSITGTLVVEVNGEKREIPVNITIPKLPGTGGHVSAPGKPKPAAPVPVKAAKSAPQTGDKSQEPVTSAVMLAALGAGAILLKLIKKRN